MIPAAFDYLRAHSTDEAIAHLQQHGAEARVLAGHPCDEAVERIGQAGNPEHHERRAEMAVDDQQHERRDQHDPQDRQLVGEREVFHGRDAPSIVAASALTRSMASTASAPET